jgi:Tol biopolymer transport system component/DNA-binding winged helix-turn-helix (wHTH) protein
VATSTGDTPIDRPSVICFGGFEVDLQSGVVSRNGTKSSLRGQPLQLLELLLQRPGQIVTREDIRQHLWPNGTVVEFEHSVNAAVKRLRAALEDDPDKPAFIETIPRRGYRFIARIENVSSSALVAVEKDVAVLPPVVSAEAEPHVHDERRPIARYLLVASVVLALLVVPFFMVRSHSNQVRNSPSPSSRAEILENLRVTPLTTLPGRSLFPSFSPDGSQVAFAWDEGNSDAKSPFNLYVKVIGSEKIEQLTHGPAEWIVPAWSPDGRTIAFAREGAEKEGIFSVSARGGPERKLATANLPFGGYLSLSWSPDGRQLVYYTPDGIRILTPETGEIHPVDTGRCESHLPVFSPDGQWIAFICYLNGDHNLDLFSLESGTTKHLLKGWDGRMAWTNDSQRIVSTGSAGLWEININGGERRRLSISAESSDQPAIASRGDRLAYVASQTTANIWRADTRTGLSRRVLAPSIVEQRNPDISPDGTRIAFESERSGFHEVWVANLDGSDAVQLSNFHQAALTGSPQWSPDGRRIAFDSRVTGKSALYLVDSATALPQRVSTNDIAASTPTWSADGKWIYFRSESSESAEHGALYRVVSEGGIPERISHARGLKIHQSRDGHTLFFATEEINAGINALNAATGEQHALDGMPKLECGNDWVLGSKGIFFVVSTPKPSIDFYDLSSRRVTRKISLDRLPSHWGGLSISPDETWLAYSQIDQNSSHLSLVESAR